MDLAGRYLIRLICRPSVITTLLVCAFIYYILLPSLGTDSTEFSLYEDEISHSKKVLEPEKVKKKKKSTTSKKTEPVKDIESTKAPPPIHDPNEFIHGSKRYKLFEKKHLNFKRAEAYCKKMDGRLARTEKLDEMQRLQMLIRKAKLVSDDLWIGQERKVWKKHAWKDRDHPPGMDKKALGAMGAMMMGGGKQEMCPALSLSTRALAPVMCRRELPFVCEFDNVPTKPKVEIENKPKRKEEKVRKKSSKNEKNNKKEEQKKVQERNHGTARRVTAKPKSKDTSTTVNKNFKTGKQNNKRIRDEM